MINEQKTLTEKTKRMLFGLSQLSINNHQIYNEIKEPNHIEHNHKDIILSQWRFYQFDKGFNECLCGTRINNIFTVKNRYNNNMALVGCVCIKHIRNDYLTSVSRDILTYVRNRSRGTNPRKQLNHVLCDDANCKMVIESSELLNHLKENHPDLYKARALIEFNKEILILKDEKTEAGEEKIFFGKHRGKTINYIHSNDISYFNWVLSNNFENASMKIKFTTYKTIIDNIIELQKKITILTRNTN